MAAAGKSFRLEFATSQLCAGEVVGKIAAALQVHGGYSVKRKMNLRKPLWPKLSGAFGGIDMGMQALLDL